MEPVASACISHLREPFLGLLQEKPCDPETPECSIVPTPIFNPIARGSLGLERGYQRTDIWGNAGVNDKTSSSGHFGLPEPILCAVHTLSRLVL